MLFREIARLRCLGELDELPLRFRELGKPLDLLLLLPRSLLQLDELSVMFALSQLRRFLQLSQLLRLVQRLLNRFLARTHLPAIRDLPCLSVRFHSSTIHRHHQRASLVKRRST